MFANVVYPIIPFSPVSSAAFLPFLLFVLLGPVASNMLVVVM
jgi:hypothetical protein